MLNRLLEALLFQKAAQRARNVFFCFFWTFSEIPVRRAWPPQRGSSSMATGGEIPMSLKILFCPPSGCGERSPQGGMLNFAIDRIKTTPLPLPAQCRRGVRGNCRFTSRFLLRKHCECVASLRLSIDFLLICNGFCSRRAHLAAAPLLSSRSWAE